MKKTPSKAQSFRSVWLAADRQKGSAEALP